MPGIIASLALTKTLALICDIRKGRLSDVPAFSDIARGQAQNPNYHDFISSRLPQSVFSPKSCRRQYFDYFVETTSPMRFDYFAEIMSPIVFFMTILDMEIFQVNFHYS